MNFIKEYQDLIGKIIIAFGIVFAGYMISEAVQDGFSNINFDYLGKLIREGLLKIAENMS